MKRAIFGILIGLCCPAVGWAQAALDTPAEGSFQSGIGYVRGWKCTAEILTFTIDNGPPAPLSYGSSRGDTAGVCKDDGNNGFIAQWNWNLLSSGEHTIRVYDNGVQFAQATFSVKTLGHEFLTGLSAEAKVVNFGNQINVTIRWQESCQCFVIVDTTAPFRLGPPVGTDPDGGGPLPLCEPPDAGRLATAGDIFGYYQQYQFIHRDIFLCALSPGNPQYNQFQGNAFSVNSNPGYVYYDVRFLNFFDGANEFDDDLILAHELGHQVQYDNPARSATPGTIPFEIQADCLAGTYFGRLVFTNPEFMVTDFAAVVNAACTSGLAANLGWTSVDTHGKCEARALAFEIGFVLAFSAFYDNLPFDPLAACAVSQ